MGYPTKPDTDRDGVDTETFWKNQIDEYRKTKLSRRAYCRERHLNYHHFLYRYRKLVLSQKKERLKAIPIQVNTVSAIGKRASGLCTLEFNGGQQLTVYDQTVLSLLLKRLF